MNNETLPMPQSIAAEAGAISVMLDDHEAALRGVEIIKADAFTVSDYREIFNAIGAILSRGDNLNTFAVCQELRRRDLLDAMGGNGYIFGLIATAEGGASIDSYAEEINKAAKRRELIKAGEAIAKLGYESEDADVAGAQAENLVFDLGQQGGAGRSRSITELMRSSAQNVERRYRNPVPFVGLPSGLQDVDELTGGFEQDRLYVIGAPPRTGKTSFVLNVAAHVALHEHKRVAIFTYEMGAEQLAARLVASVARLNSRQIKTGNLPDNAWPQLIEAHRALAAAPIHIEEDGSMGPGQILSRCRRIASQFGGLDMVIVDYLQLVPMPTDELKARKLNRTQEVGEVAKMLKNLAKQLHVPVLAVASINRAAENREDKRSQLRDLRESGEIDFAADVVAFLYRASLYKHHAPGEKPDNLTEFIVAKNRDEEPGTAYLRFLGEQTRFVCDARQWQQEAH